MIERCYKCRFTIFRESNKYYYMRLTFAHDVVDVAVIQCIAEAGINLDYIYCFLGGKTGKAYLVCKVPDVAGAQAALTAAGATLVEQEELTEL